MTPTRDVVQKLLGAVKLMREKAEAGILDNEWGINSDAACQLVIEDADKIIAQIEARLAGEGKDGSHSPLLSGPSEPDDEFDGWIAGDPDATALEVLWAKLGWDAHKFKPEPDPIVSVSDHANPSPINACIRAAKKVIAALNLPEGAGVAMDENGFWHIFMGEAWPTQLVFTGGKWGSPWACFTLPDTAIPPWPGDFRGSWITALTEEVL